MIAMVALGSGVCLPFETVRSELMVSELKQEAFGAAQQAKKKSLLWVVILLRN